MRLLAHPSRDTEMPCSGSLPCPVDILFELEAVSLRNKLQPPVWGPHEQVLLHVSVEEGLRCIRLVHLNSMSSIYVVTLRRRFFSDVFTSVNIEFHSITISKAHTSKRKRPRTVTSYENRTTYNPQYLESKEKQPTKFISRLKSSHHKEEPYESVKR